MQKLLDLHGTTTAIMALRRAGIGEGVAYETLARAHRASLTAVFGRLADDVHVVASSTALHVSSYSSTYGGKVVNEFGGARLWSPNAALKRGLRERNALALELHNAVVECL